MSCEVKYTEQAFKDIQKLNQKDKDRILDAVKILNTCPLTGKPLQAQFKGKYSLRVGNLRIIYIINSEGKLIIVLKIKHRREAYR
jgi:mRNA interferase RelE/StbE